VSTPPGPSPDELDLRASDDERRRTTDRLAAAAASGELTPEEHAQRMEQALAAKTRRDLAALTADLQERPADPDGVAAERSAHRRELVENWRSWLAVAVVLNVIWLISRLASDNPAWGGWGSYWPIWPLGIWGAFLLVRTVMPGDDD
jgi:hypothetical protein